MPPKVQKSKAAKMLAAQSSSKKGKKKKWSKGKVKEKADRAVVIDQATFDRIAKDMKKAKVVTTNTLVQNYKVTASVARHVMTQLAEEGVLKPVVRSKIQYLYTRA